MTDSFADAPAPLTPLRAIFWGGALVGLLDGLWAVIVFGLRSGATPVRIFQGVASGLLGSAAREGGIPTALLGVLLHFTVATCIATVYVLVSRRLPVLLEHPVVCGLAFGVVAFFVMHYVVVPLSAVPMRPGSRSGLFTLTQGIVGHALVVGLPIALVAARVPLPSKLRLPGAEATRPAVG